MISLLVGFVLPVMITFVGKIPLSELLLLVVLLHAALALTSTRNLPAPLPSPRILAFVLVAQFVAFGSYIVSDLWHQSLPFDMIRGWVRMIFLLLDTAALALLFGAGNRTFILLQIGLVLSTLFTFLDGPLFGDYWKFCFAYPVTVLILLATPRLLGFWATAAASVVLGGFHLHMGFRSLGWECLLLAGLLVGRTLPRLWRKCLFLACLPIVIVGISSGFTTLLSGPRGEATRSNVERSSMMQAAWEGFLASPIIGNGSWFSRSNVWDNFLLIRAQRERESGGGLGFDNTDLHGAAIHSQLLTALAEGGLLGGTFFIIYTVLLLFGFWYLLTEAPWHWLMPIRLSILITSLCGVMLTPFSGISRLYIAMAVALNLVLLAERNGFLRRRKAPDAWSRPFLPSMPPKPS